MVLQAFNYVAGKNPKVLILGSMPGEESLKQEEYYAHPRNAFWEIMGNLLGFDKNISYEERLNYLKNNRIALWDVVYKCKRKGSLDNNIDPESLHLNDFTSFFKSYPGITDVFFNGRKAENLFKKYIIKKLPEDINNRLEYHFLPSTSPANASLKKEQKIKAWEKIPEVL